MLTSALIGANLGLAEQRPLDRFEFENMVPRGHWAATRTESGRIFAKDRHGLVELSGGEWLQVSSEGEFEWDTLAADPSGAIWAAANGEIGVYEPDVTGVFRYRSLTSLLPEDKRDISGVWNVLPDSSGRMVFVGAGIVVRTDGQTAESWRLPVARRLYGWIDEGRVLIAGEGGRVYLLSDSGPEHFPHSHGISVTDFGWSERLGKDDWIGIAEVGLFSGQPELNRRFDAINRVLQKSAPTSVRRIRDGRLAISTYYNGLFLVDTTTGAFEQIAEKDGLLSLNVSGMLLGEGDWLWAVTIRGLNRLSTSRAVAVFPGQAGLDGATARNVEVGKESVFVTTDSGSFEIPLEDGQAGSRKLNDNRFICQERFGSKYLGGTMFGLYEFDRNSRRKVLPENADVKAIVVPASFPDIAIYSTGSELRAARVRDGNYEVIASAAMGAGVETMIEDSGGVLWVATGSEVSQVVFVPATARFVVRETHKVSASPSAHSSVTHLVRIEDTVLLLSGGKLFGLDGKRAFAPVPMFAESEVTEIAPGGVGEAWALLRPSTHGSASPRLVRLSIDDGDVIAEEIGTAGLLSAGQLRNVHAVAGDAGRAEVWIGTDEGLIRLLPELAQPAGLLPSLRLSLSWQDGALSRVSVDESPEFPLGTGSIKLGWSVPDATPEDLFVETRILGADPRWVAAGDHTTREFSGLGDGRYEFQARTVDSLGRPGPVSSVSFVVLPPWYRTPAALSGFAVALLGFGFTAWQFKARTARRRAEELEERVAARTRELARVNAEMTRFIARMNHEIRNPLNGLLGAVGVLEQLKQTGREGRMIHILRACADHLGAVVEDVLDFSNIEGGRIVVQDRAFSVEEMLEAVPRMMLAESERTGTEVVTTIAADVPRVIVSDPDRIRQILVNFLSNALKFAPGEPVQIEVTATTVDESPWLRFAVRDHGPGISEADKQSLFQMFERGRNPAKQKVRGMGIGLATCRLLARRMGGEVGVISGLGEGSEFFLKLPLRVESTVDQVPADQPLAQLQKLACLIVEDQEFNRVILRDMLERAGCSVDEAADAETALRLAAMNRYEVVFTDLELPDAAPGEILKMLREQYSAVGSLSPALVVTTAYATENVRQTCLGAGATAFLAKPLAAAKVIAVLRKIDTARRPVASLSTPEPEATQAAGTGVIFHLARIRGCDVAGMAAEIAGNIDEEVHRLHAGALSGDSREVAQRAHRLLSLSALADAPELAGVAAGIQAEARDGRVPSAKGLAALVDAMALAKSKLGSITSAGATGAQNRAPGRSESTASSHSD